PIKFVMLPVFLAPLLAAYAVRAYLEASVEFRNRFLRAGVTIGIVLLAAIGFLITVTFYRPGEDELVSVTAWNGLTRAAFLVAELGLCFALGRGNVARSKSLIALGLATLVWLDLATHAPRQNPSVDRSVFLP